jgi:O-antigen ligase
MLLRQSWMQMFLVGFALLAIAFLRNKDLDDTIYIVDFLFLPFGFLFAMGFTTLQGRVGAQGFAWLCILGALAAAIVGCVQVFALGVDRASGWSNSPIHFSNFAVMFGFMALGGTFLAEGRWKWVLLSGPVLGLLAATMADSRGAFVVAIGLALVFAVMQVALRPGRPLVKASIAIALVAVPLLAVILANFFGFTRPYETLLVFRDLLSGRVVADSSSAYRLEMYSGGLKAFLDAPLFGYGWHSQMAAALPYMSDFARAGYASEGWGYLHNDALSFAVSGGLIALLAYGLWILAPIVGLTSVPKDSWAVARSYFAIVLAAGLSMGGATDVLFMSELAKVLLVGLTAAILILCRTPQPGDKTIL